MMVTITFCYSSPCKTHQDQDQVGPEIEITKIDNNDYLP